MEYFIIARAAPTAASALLSSHNTRGSWYCFSISCCKSLFFTSAVPLPIILCTPFSLSTSCDIILWRFVIRPLHKPQKTLPKVVFNGVILVTEARMLGACLSPNMVGHTVRSVLFSSLARLINFCQILSFGTPTPENAKKTKKNLQYRSQLN